MAVRVEQTSERGQTREALRDAAAVGDRDARVRLHEGQTHSSPPSRIPTN